MKRSQRVTAAILAAGALFAAGTPVLAENLPYDSIPDGMTEERYYALRDKSLSFDEIGDLILTGNPVYTQYKDFYSASAADMEASFGEAAMQTMETLDYVSGAVSDMEKQLASLGGSDAMLEQSIRRMKKAGDELRKSMNAAGRSISRAPGMVTGKLGVLRDSLNASMEGLFIQEKQLEATRVIAARQCDVLRTALELQEHLLAQGLGTRAEADSAALRLREAENSLLRLDQGISGIRAALGQQLGMDMEGVVFEELPEPDLAFVRETDAAADREKAVDSSPELHAARRAADGNQYSFDIRDMRVSEMKAKLAAVFDGLYASMQQNASLYEAAAVSRELAVRNLAAAERQRSLGLLGNAEYQGAVIRGLSQELTYQTARLNLIQSISTYRWAVRGVLSSE